MAITNGYCTLAQIRQLGEWAAGDTADDAMLELSVEAASRQIDGFCGRRFWVDGSVVARDYVAESSKLVEVDDISTTTGLIVATDTAGDGTFATTLTTADYLLFPLNAADEVPVRPYTSVLAVGTASLPCLSSGRPGVRITAKFGWPAVPDNVEKACLTQAWQLYKAKDAPFGIATFGDMGGGLRVSGALNPIARALVDQYAKPAVG